MTGERMRLFFCALVVWLAISVFAGDQAVSVLFFYQPGCAECDQVNREVLPDLAVVFPGQIRLERLDLSDPEHAARLITVQEAFDVWDNAPVSMLVGGRVFLSGIEDIREKLIPSIQMLLDGSWDGAQSAILYTDESDTASAVERRVSAFSLYGVAAAGLVDSLNPCAISVLIFFVSVLTMAKVRGRRLAAAGGAFVAASFLTYFLLGFGLLTVVRALPLLGRLKSVVDAVMILVLLVLGVLSVRDAWVFHRRRDPSQVCLQLPPGMKARIHRLTRSGMQTHRLVAAGAIIGSGVTLMESVCTGQVYVPALVLMARAGRSLVRTLSLLMIYNLMFVLPLIIVFVLVGYGLQLPALLAWSRRHVAPAKLMMALLFFVMALVVFLMDS